MPEIKHQFMGGKMNKDLDERLVPNGEYRDAMNIQVSTSEESDVGTVQNILGNLEIPDQDDYLTSSAICVGTIADEKNDKLYWFIKDTGFDGIFEYTSGGTEIVPILIDTKIGTSDAVLKFDLNKIITGINIIDGLLFWTDNQSEPKKINIEISKLGTSITSFPIHTNFINDKRNPLLEVPIREEHITVIKKSPKTAPTVKLKSQRSNDFGGIYTGVMRITSPPDHLDGPTWMDGYSYQQTIPYTWNDENESSMWIMGSPQNHHYDFSNLSVGDYFDTYIETDIYGESGFELDWEIGDTLLFKELGGEFYDEVPAIPLRDYSVKARIRSAYQKTLNNVAMPINEFDANGDDIPHGPNDPKTFQVTWKQGKHDGRMYFQGRKGFDGQIEEIHVYNITNDPAMLQDLFPNPYFQVTDVDGSITGTIGTALPQWFLSECSENTGDITSTNPDAESAPGAGDSYNATGIYPLIDAELYPCYPGKYWYGDNPWEIVYSDNPGGGYAKAPNGMLTAGWSGNNTPGPGSSHTVTEFQTWRYFANSLPLVDADGVTQYSNIVNGVETGASYSLINQYGHMFMGDFDFGVDCGCMDWVVEGDEYTMVYIISDSGHTYGLRNGHLTLGNAGLVNPWLNANYFIDTPENIARNGDFITPDGDGDSPKFWNMFQNTDGTTGWNYVPGEHYVEGGKNDVQIQGIGIKINQSSVIPAIEVDVFYEVSFELTDIGDFDASGNPMLSGGLFLGLAGESPGVGIDYWQTPTVYTEGIHNFTLFTSQANAQDGSGLGSGNRIFLESVPLIPGSGNGFIGRVQNISVKRQNAPNANVRCEVLALNNPPTAPENSELRYVVDLLDKETKIFEFKFPRFAYRYKYYDNEYSAISPFSPVAFLPGKFNYQPKKGFNLAMTNRLVEANIKDFRFGVPDGVVAIDILYKDDTSPSIYVVDTIKPRHAALGDGDTVWEEGEYTINSEQISNMIPSNQLLRPWDAVPLKALAQDISGNRIIYGNYVQGYDLKYDNGFDDVENYYPDFNFDILSTSNLDLISQKSIKSLREYQLGVVFVDQYGRETPVISNSTGNQAIEKKEAENINQIQVGFKNNKFPPNMKYLKFFVKETSNEYYNLAMDRWYDAEDGGVWLAFPSSDRNKVDIDTFLILKKAGGSTTMVKAEAKYKVLDIKGNAPAFIKQKKTLISSKTHNFEDTANPSIFGNSLNDIPSFGESSFKMNYKPYFNTSGSNLDEIKDGVLYIEFLTGFGNISKRYRISKITNDYDDGVDGPDTDGAQYSVILTEGFGSDINLITDDPFKGLSVTKINNGTIVNIYKYTEEDSAKFDGRFFVKISIDTDFNEQMPDIGTDLKYRSVGSKKLYYMSYDPGNVLHNNALTGQTIPNTTNTYDTANAFNQFAPFFRNYNRSPGHLSVPLLTSPSATYDVSAFAFGPDSDTDRPWLKELAWITIEPNHWTSCPIGIERSDNDGGSASWPGVKVADDHGWNNAEKNNGVFNSAGEQEKGDVWFIDGGSFHTDVSLQDPPHQLQWTEDHSAGGLNNTRLIDGPSGIATGIETTEDHSTFEISIGGIYNEKVQYGSSLDTSGGEGPTPNFWDIGKPDGYHKYSELSGVISQLQPGKKFRFREDPTREIYTIQEDVQEINRIRYDTIPQKPSSGSNTIAQLPLYSWRWYSGDQTSGGFFGLGSGQDIGWYASLQHPNPANAPAGWMINSASGGCVGDIYALFNKFTPQLSPNFSKTWKPKVLNSAGNPEVNWNPIGPLGPITNGLNLTIFHSSEESGGLAPEKYVVVDSLEGTHTDGKKYNVTVGMILISHSNGATPATDVFNGSAGLEHLAIKKIETDGPNFKLHLTGYSKILTNVLNPNGLTITNHEIFDTPPVIEQAMIFAQPTMNGYSQYSVNRINAQDPAGRGWTGPTIDGDTGEQIDSGNPGIVAIGYNLDFVEAVDMNSDPNDIVSENPPIWETEPKEAKDLDIYYEASGLYPLQMREDTKLLTIPIGSIVETVTGVFIESGTTVDGVNYTNGWTDFQIVLKSPSDNSGYIDPDTNVEVVGTLVGAPYITNGDRLKITKPNGEIIIVTITGWSTLDANGRTTTFTINSNLYGIETSYILNWHNCYSFGNGVESNRVRDNFNLPFISNGPKVSTTLEEDYNQEHRKYGLIYSGLYNSNSGVNNLNQFIAAEKITKDINPIYGSIQKIHSRDSDLVTLCEDKCLRILANKDAVYNADGNPNLTATSNVLGQTIPFSGEFGISTNPESFASESYRVYFTDRVRGAVMRLSKDGLTPISMYGMKDWFKDNLKLSTLTPTSKLIGSYDDKKDEYNITLSDISTTVSFKEDVKGWVSFKSFVPEFGISMANDYYTMKAGRLWKHHDESVDRNTFYGNHSVEDYSSITVVLNEGPGSIKSFHTLNYEGSQSKITEYVTEEKHAGDPFQPNTTYNDQEYYNLSAKDGWSIESIVTDKDTGYITDFIEKEGKWFTNMNKFIDITL